MKTPLRIGIAGYGVVGKGRRRVIDVDPDVKRAAVCNQKMPGRGKFPDGTVSRFHDYPWRAGDIVVIEGVSPWHQIRYSPRPPFWHWNRNERLAVWHRLARLQKDPG